GDTMQMQRGPLIAAFTAVCLSATLAACGGAAKDNASTSHSSSSSSSSSASPSSTKAAAPAGKLKPRNLESTGAGANPTIADYISNQHITETPIHQGDPGAPQIDLPLPDGWQVAGDDTPAYAYGALIYTGPEAQG